MPWQIINIGAEKISCLRADGKVINLLYTELNDLVDRGEITGDAEPHTEINKCQSEIEEILRSALPKDIKEANRRYEIIQPYLQSNPPARPSSTIRRWRDKYREAEKIYGNGYLGLLPKISAKGNYKPKLNEAILKFMGEYIAQHYETPKNRRITGVYRGFKEVCKEHEPPFVPPSEKRFRLEIKRRSGYEQTLSRSGSRVAKYQKPFYSTSAMPRHGALPWESAHIEHTQLDDELVSSLISLATCNSSSAISLTNINLGRPWVTFMIDSYSRRILVAYLSYEEPSIRSCMMVIRICVKRFQRLPQIIVTDNGKEFHSIYFKQLLAYCQCTHKYRPPGEPRNGSPIERVFGTTNTLWIHELKGNTQILTQHRQVTKSVNPKEQAVWTIGEFYQSLEYWAYEIYDKREHSALGQSPRQAFETGIALGGRREFRRIEYSEAFRILTLPSPSYGKTRIMCPGRGVKINNIYYWSDAFRDPEIERTSVDVKYDPFNVGVAYALVRGHWLECISDQYQYLQGRTEKEIMVVTEDLRRRKSGHARRVEVSDAELVEHLKSAEILESNLLIQRLRGLENKTVLELIEGKNISLFSDKARNVEDRPHFHNFELEDLSSEGLQAGNKDSIQFNNLNYYSEF